MQGLPNPTICKKLTNFLNEMKGLTFCPITQLEIKDPWLGTDQTSYEKESINQWLTEHSISPATRQPMEMNF